jgi:hypothetical protein
VLRFAKFGGMGRVALDVESVHPGVGDVDALLVAARIEHASTRRPVLVVVAAISSATASRSVSGRPLMMRQNNRCLLRSILQNGLDRTFLDDGEQGENPNPQSSNRRSSNSKTQSRAGRLGSAGRRPPGAFIARGVVAALGLAVWVLRLRAQAGDRAQLSLLRIAHLFWAICVSNSSVTALSRSHTHRRLLANDRRRILTAHGLDHTIPSGSPLLHRSPRLPRLRAWPYRSPHQNGCRNIWLRTMEFEEDRF